MKRQTEFTCPNCSRKSLVEVEVDPGDEVRIECPGCKWDDWFPYERGLISPTV